MLLNSSKLNIERTPGNVLLAARTANRILACLKSNVTSWSREVILPLCSTPGRPHLCCVQHYSPQGHGPVGVSLEEGHKTHQRDGTPPL